MAGLYNAVCRIHEPLQTPTGTQDLQREHRTRLRGEARCSLRQMTMTAEANALGTLAVGAWQCRLHSPVPIRPGWELEAQLDGETDWMRFVVRRAARTLHDHLMLERV